MYRQRTQKAWGHTANRGWARLFLDRARDLIIHSPAHRGANGAAMPTDEDDQDGHFFYNHPERGGLLRCLGALKPLLLLFRSNPPLRGGDKRKIAHELARTHVSYYNDDTRRTKGMYRTRIQKAWGHTAHRGWARLLLDRTRDLIIHGSAHRGANGVAMPTDEDDQDGHFFYNHPERGAYFAA